MEGKFKLKKSEKFNWLEHIHVAKSWEKKVRSFFYKLLSTSPENLIAIGEIAGGPNVCMH